MNEKGSWKKGSIEGQLFAPTGEKFEGRSLEEYCKELGINESDLIGKKILDVGSGPTARLERELRDRAMVVSLSPDYSDAHYREWLEGNEGEVKNAVAALGEVLPFKDGTALEGFDYALLLHVTEHVRFQSLLKIILESYRTLRTGGKVVVYPIHPDSNPNMKEFAGEHGLQLSLVPTNQTIRVYVGDTPAGHAPLMRATFTKH